jgi:hypothetical protein
VFSMKTCKFLPHCIFSLHILPITILLSETILRVERFYDLKKLYFQY